MDSERTAGDWMSSDGWPGPWAAGARLDKMVPPVVVAAISIAGVLTSLMQPRLESTHGVPAGTRPVAAVLQAPPVQAVDGRLPGACADCGVVLAVLPIEPAPEAGPLRPGPRKAP